ncbi:unnamed protein product [Mesocestoides corti]|uniref:C2H2-type domain-containing protein n=1 Tax=Mesocestoides corti TaxID=53468 RepID=A0A0R3UCI9_MESCO|nr:unnamed protein product [Mesocestoides corti]
MPEPSPILTATATVHDEGSGGGDKSNLSRSWQNHCQSCNTWFNKRSQLDAHLYATSHQRVSRPKFSPTNFFQTSTGIYNLPVDSLPQNPLPHSPSNCSLDDANNWWSHQQKRKINFSPATLPPHQTPVAASTGAADQYCSYQATHHIIHHTMFTETTTTPTI